MSRSKKIFFLVAIVFFMLLMYVSYDFSRRTTFPGSRKEGAGGHPVSDTVQNDSIPHDTLP